MTAPTVAERGSPRRDFHEARLPSVPAQHRDRISTAAAPSSASTRVATPKKRPRAVRRPDWDDRKGASDATREEQTKNASVLRPRVACALAVLFLGWCFVSDPSENRSRGLFD